MQKLLILLGAAAAITFYAPTQSNAQGIGVVVPGVGIQVGEPDRPRYRDRRATDRRAIPRARSASDRGCRTITIQRDDGVGPRIRRCD